MGYRRYAKMLFVKAIAQQVRHKLSVSGLTVFGCCINLDITKTWIKIGTVSDTVYQTQLSYSWADVPTQAVTTLATPSIAWIVLYHRMKWQHVMALNFHWSRVHFECFSFVRVYWLHTLDKLNSVIQLFSDQGLLFCRVLLSSKRSWAVSVHFTSVYLPLYLLSGLKETQLKQFQKLLV